MSRVSSATGLPTGFGVFGVFDVAIGSESLLLFITSQIITNHHTIAPSAATLASSTSVLHAFFFALPLSLSITWHLYHPPGSPLVSVEISISFNLTDSARSCHSRMSSGGRILPGGIASGELPARMSISIFRGNYNAFIQSRRSVISMEFISLCPCSYSYSSAFFLFFVLSFLVCVLTPTVVHQHLAA